MKLVIKGVRSRGKANLRAQGSAQWLMEQESSNMSGPVPLKNKKYFDLSAFNTTSDWKRIELPFRRLSEDPEGFILAAIVFITVSIPLNVFLIVQIIRWVSSIRKKISKKIVLIIVI